MTSYRNYPTNLPYFVDQFTGGARLNAYADVLDKLYQDIVAAGANGLIDLCDPSALNSHGINRDLRRNSNESDIVYRSRLKQAFEIWKRAGSDEGILLALQWLGLTNTNIVHWQDLVDRGVPKAFGGSYHTIAGADANGGVRFVNPLEKTYKVIFSVGVDSSFFLQLDDTQNPPEIKVSLYGDNAGNSLSTAKQVVKLLRDNQIQEKTGVLFDFTGSGDGLAGAGQVTLTSPIYTHFFVEIDQPNPYQTSQNWNENELDQTFLPITSPTSNDLLGINGLSPSRLFAVGSNNTLLWWDGEKWTSLTPTATDDYLCISQHGVYGGANGEVQFISILNGQPAYGNYNVPFGAISVNGIWSIAQNNFFAALDGGKIGRYNNGAISVTQTPVTENLLAIWGIDANNVWAVGVGGKIVYYDGATWTEQTSGVTQNLYAIQGASATEIYAVGAVGKVLRYDGATWSVDTTPLTQTLRGITINTRDRLQACGNSGVLINYDGNSWYNGNSSASATLFSMVSPITDDTWIVGSGGTILRRVSKKFNDQIIPQFGSIRSIWINSSNSIWVGAENGKLAYFDGKSWTLAVTPLLSSSINDVSILQTPKIGFAVGSNGKIWQYKRDVAPYITPMTSPTTSALYAITAISSTLVFAAGAGGTLLKFDGLTWSLMQSPTNQTLYALWAKDANNVYACGDRGTLLKYDGNAWLPLTSGTTAALYGISGSSSRVVAVGANGVSVIDSGTGFAPVTTGTAQDLYSVAMFAKDNIAWACGGNGVILRLNQNLNTWTAETSNVTVPLYKIAVDSVSGVQCAVGNGGTFVRRNFGQPTWGLVATGSTDALTSIGLASWNVAEGLIGSATGRSFRYDNNVTAFLNFGFAYPILSMWGSSSTNIYAATGSTTLLQYDGSTWTTQQLPLAMGNMGAQGANRVFGWADHDIIAVGDGGYVAHYDGTAWSTLIFPTTQNLYCVWGTSGKDFYVGGAAGNLYYYNGTSFTLVAGIPNTTIFRDMIGFNRQSIFAVGNNGNNPVLYKYDGSSWSSISVPATLRSTSFTTIWGQDPSKLWIFRGNDTVVFYDGLSFTPQPMEKYYTQLAVAGSTTLLFFGGVDANGNGKIVQLIPDRFKNVWNGGGTWDFFELIDGITDDIKAAIRKFKAAGTSCRFLRINIQGTWVTVPVGELAEINANGDYITKDYLYDYLS